MAIKNKPHFFSSLESARGLATLLPILFLGFFFLYPLINILRASLTLDTMTKLLNRAYFFHIAWFTAWQAALSTGLTLLFGLPAAYLFARVEFRGKSFLKSLTTIPFVMPTVVVAAGFRALFGSNGLANQIVNLIFHSEAALIQIEQTLWIILLAHIFYNISVVIRLVGGFWTNLDLHLEEGAKLLGASNWQTFREITLPLLRPSLISAAILIYLFTFTSFGVILILGGPAFSTLETEIYRQYVTFLDPGIAAILSLLQIFFTFGLMSVYARWQRTTAVPLNYRPQQSSSKRPKTSRQKIWMSLVLGGLIVFLVSPLLALIWRSLLDRTGHLTLANYAALSVVKRGSILFVAPLTAVRNSILFALLTVFFAGLLGMLAVQFLSRPSRFRNWLDPLFMLPLGASAVTLGFGYVVTFNRLRTSPLLVLAAHTLVALPFVIRSLLPVLQGISPSLREAAALLGASPVRVWREIDLPIMARALLVAAVFAFTVSMGEFGATSFIVRPNSGFLTMPIAIERYLSNPGALNFGQALAMSSILMTVSAAGFLAIERFRFADIGEF